jgi:hypothetical protein
MTSLNVLATVPIEAPTFGVILYDNITNIKTRLNNNQLDGFDILILDDDNNAVNFNNVNWCISVLIILTKERKDKNKNDFFDYVKILGAIQNQTDNQAEPDITQTEPEPEPEQQVEPDIQGNITDDNSLDLLLYNNGINPTTGTLTGV